MEEIMELDKSVQVVIGLMGPKMCGKDTIADYAIENFGAAGKFATAGALKDLCSKVFRLEPKFFNELKNEPFAKPLILTGKQARAIFDEVRALIPLELLPIEKFKPWKIGVQFYEGRVFPTPRAILQYVGTEMIQSVYKDFHCVIAYDKIKNKPGTWFITDMRFQHEQRYANEQFQLFYPIRISGRNEVKPGEEEHPSECEWKHIIPFATIDNSKEGLEHFYAKASEVFKVINDDALLRISQDDKLGRCTDKHIPIIAGSKEVPVGSRFKYAAPSQVDVIEYRDMDKFPTPTVEINENPTAGRIGESYERHR